MSEAGPQLQLEFPALPPRAGATARSLEIRRSARRSLSIEVHADLRVIVRVPRDCPAPVIDAFVAARRSWVERQLGQFAARPPSPLNRYADGETHWFLGEALELRLRPHATTGVAHLPGVLQVGGAGVADAGRTGRAVQAWFRARARELFPVLVSQWRAHPRFARYPLPALRIRAMRTHWGTFSPRSGMTLNLLLIHAPLPAIEYVVVHELCHYRYRGHGPGFRGLLEAVLPDWRERKRQLEESIAAMPTAG
jgi:predicted metal-dependent hydrolase